MNTLQRGRMPESTVNPPTDGAPPARPGAHQSEGFIDQVYGDLRQIAHHLMSTERPGHTLQATALVNEAWLRMNRRKPVALHDRNHLIAIATIQMRRALVDHARKNNADRRPNHRLRVTLGASEFAFDRYTDDSTLDLIDLCVAMEELERLKERHCRVFELRFFGGLTIDECAAHLQVAPRTIKYDWQFATAWISKRLGLNKAP